MLELNIVYRDHLNEYEKAAVVEIVNICNAHDDSSYSAPLDADIYALLYDEDMPSSSGDPALDDPSLSGDAKKPRVRKAQLNNAFENDFSENTSNTVNKLRSVLAVYHIGATENGKDIDEISAFTLPDFRRKGYFSALFSYLKPVLREVISAAVYEDCEDTLKALAALKAKKSHDEYLMERELCKKSFAAHDKDCLYSNSKKKNGEGKDMKARAETVTFRNNEDLAKSEKPTHKKTNIKIEPVSENELFCSSRCCECSILRYSEESLYLYGMLTYAKYQGKGCGYAFLTELIAELSPSETISGSDEIPAQEAPSALNTPDSSDMASDLGAISASASLSPFNAGSATDMNSHKEEKREAASKAGKESKASDRKNAISFFPGAKKLILQVSSLNVPAVGLYKKCGFEIKESLSYYRIKL